MFLLGTRKNKFPLNCPFYGHFSYSIGFEQNFIMPMVSLTTREVGSALFSSIFISVASRCLLHFFPIDLILSSFDLSFFIKSFAIIRFKIKIVVRIAFGIGFMSEPKSVKQGSRDWFIFSSIQVNWPNP